MTTKSIYDKYKKNSIRGNTMESLCKISTDILDLFRKKWINGNQKSYDKFIKDIILCCILTEIAVQYSHKRMVYTLPFAKFEHIISALYKKGDSYTYYRNFMRSLRKGNEYFYCIELGHMEMNYKTGEKEKVQSVYCTTEKFAKILDRICERKLQFTELNLTALHRNKRGIDKITMFKYETEKKNTVYEFSSLSELFRDIDFSGMTLEDVNKKKKEIKENTKISRIKTIIGLDSCIVGTSNEYKRMAPSDYEYDHKAVFKTEAVKRFAQMDPLAVKDKSLRMSILTMQDIESEMSQNGEFDLYYRRSKYGRLYQFGGYNIQLLSKEHRNEVLDDVCIDIKASFFSLMHNYAKINGYEGDLPYLQRMFDDPDTYRKNVWNDIKKYDLPLKYEYVKTGFTSMGYGAKTSEKQIAAAIKYNQDVALVTIGGYFDKYTPERLVSHPDFKGLRDDVNKVWDFMIKKIKSSGKKFLTNDAGAVINISTSKKNELVTFVYHGMEVKALFAIMSMFDGMKDPYGLLLHDGLYVRRDCMKGITIPMIQEHVFNETGYSLKFSLENA